MKKDTSVVLSISMLTSGKRDIKKSLECLQLFKKNLPCEIILVDTGCSEEQRRYIEKYGDKIVDFTWCNDFAAARNAGLKEARGEWFMYMDDDEWFVDPQEIIAFFRTGEYKWFHSASYGVRDYLDFEGMRYVDNHPIRMTELTPETRFQGKIHEYLEPIREPRKHFADHTHHYGYVYRNAAEKEAHFRRNEVPLLEMRKSHLGETRWISLLAQEYFVMEDYERTIEVCKAGLDECRRMEKDGVKYVTALFGSVYAFLLISMECLESYEEEEVWLKQAMSHPLLNLEEMAPTMAYYCFLGARLYCLKKRYEESRSCLRRYIDYFYKLKDNLKAVERGAVLATAGVFQTHTLNGTLMCMEALIRLQDYAFAEEVFYLLDWQDKRLLHQDIWEKNILDACCSVAYHPLWVRMLQTLVSREEGMKEMLVVFLEREVAYETAEEEEKLSRLYRLISELDYEYRYILCIKILWAGKEAAVGNQAFEAARESGKAGDSEDWFRSRRIEDMFRQLFEKYPEELLNVRSEVWAVADSQGISMEPLLLQVDMGRWEELLDQWCRNASPAELQQWDVRIGSWKTRDDVHYDLFTVKCLEGYLCRYQEVCSGPAQLEALLRKYCDSVLALWDAMKNPEDERKEKDAVYVCGDIMSRSELRLTRQLQELWQYREQGDDRRTLESVKKCLGIYPVLDPAILAYADALRNDAQTRNNEAAEAQMELMRLVSALKTAAKQQLEAGAYQAAKDILLQVEKCAPGDAEVRELLARIGER